MIFTLVFVVAFSGFISISECLDGPCPNISYTPLPAGISLVGEWNVAARNDFLVPGIPLKSLKFTIVNTEPNKYKGYFSGSYTNGLPFTDAPDEIRPVTGQAYNLEHVNGVIVTHCYVIDCSNDSLVCARTTHDAVQNQCLFFLEFSVRNGVHLTEDKYNSYKNICIEKGVPERIVNGMFKIPLDINTLKQSVI